MARFHVPDVQSFTFASARSFDRDGYIGNLQVTDFTTISLSSSPEQLVVPEPASMVLLGSGLAVAALRRRRHARSA